MPSDEIIAAARECVGTRFHHQGRVVGVGIDCVGVLVHVARRIGRDPVDCQAYPRTGDGRILREHLRLNGLTVVEGEPAPGDVALFRVDSRPEPGHAGVLTDGGLVQALWGQTCCEVRYPDRLWSSRFVEAWRFPNG